MGVYTQTNGNWLTRRGTFLVLLIGFHVAFIFALKSGFAVQLKEKIAQVIQAEIINEVKEEPPPPPPPEVQMELPPVQVPPILVDIALPPPPPTAIQAPVTTETAPPPAPPQVTRVPTVVKAAVSYKPDTIDYYPPASISAEEQGRVRVRLCIDSKGRVISAEPGESSGFKRLDDAGVRMAKAFRFKPGSTDGKPNDTDCFVLPIVFNLKDVQ